MSANGHGYTGPMCWVVMGSCMMYCLYVGGVLANLYSDKIVQTCRTVNVIVKVFFFSDSQITG